MIRCLPILFVVMLFQTNASAQGTDQDYARADRLPGGWSGLVRNADLRVKWLGPTTPVYQYERDDGTSEWRTVDLETGDTRAAFDMTEINAALSELGVASDQAIAWFDFHGGNLVFMRSGDPRVWSWDAGAGTIAEIQTGDLPLGMGLERDRTDRTRGGGPPTKLFVVNTTAREARLLWLDNGGNARAYATITPGGTHEQNTYAGHSWRVEDPDGASLGVYTATEQPAVIFVRADAPKPPVQPDPIPAQPPERSPDGRYEVLFRDHDVWLRTTDTNQESRLTTDGSPDNRYESPVRWSPDSQRFVAVQTVPGETRVVTIVESSPSDQLQPTTIEFEYAKPGDRLDVSRPRLFNAASAERIDTDDAPIEQPWSVTRLRWRPDSSAFTYLYNARGHRTMRYVSVDATTGNATVVIEETSPTFIDWTNKVFVHEIEDHAEVVWMSERSGWNHLYLVDSNTGAVKNAITSGEWVVRSVERVDETGRQIYLRVMGIHPDQDPYHIHYARVDLDGSGFTLLTDGDGTHRITPSPDGAFLVDVWSRADLAPVTEIRRARDGTRVAVLAEGDVSRLIDAGWSPPERFVSKGRDGTTDIWGLIQRPTNFDPGRTYPVIESIYAGPHGQHVPKSFAVWSGSRSLGELGFVTVHIDGMGTNWRSKSFHDVAHKNLKDAGFPDRIAWMRAAAETRPWMDLERVGIYGVSAGGQNALGALLFHGDFYKAAVADCGCHDNRMDKVWWNEQWMGWPIDESYGASSNVEHASNLTGKLLLTVGELDQNVDPASTMQVVDALIKADKDFEFIVFPGLGHGTIGSPYGQRRMRDFFVRSLLGVEPRRPSEDEPSITAASDCAR
jgi:dipeptidyl-peptidase 4